MTVPVIGSDPPAHCALWHVAYLLRDCTGRTGLSRLPLLVAGIDLPGVEAGTIAGVLAKAAAMAPVLGALTNCAVVSYAITGIVLVAPTGVGTADEYPSVQDQLRVTAAGAGGTELHMAIPAPVAGVLDNGEQLVPTAAAAAAFAAELLWTGIGSVYPSPNWCTEDGQPISCWHLSGPSQQVVWTAPVLTGQRDRYDRRRRVNRG